MINNIKREMFKEKIQELQRSDQINKEVIDPFCSFNSVNFTRIHTVINRVTDCKF